MDAPKPKGFNEFDNLMRKLILIPAVGSDLSNDALNAEIARLEASEERYSEADPDAIDSDEYASILTRLCKLREERDGRK